MEQTSSARLWAGGVLAILIAGGLIYYVTSSPEAAPTPSAGAETTEGEEIAEMPDENETTGTASGTTAGGRKPIAVTTGFASVSSTTAVVVGTVDPEGLATKYWFEYGTSLTFGNFADARSVAGGSVELGASGYLTSLKPNTEYYFRIAAENTRGRVYGSAHKFITAPK